MKKRVVAYVGSPGIYIKDIKSIISQVDQIMDHCIDNSLNLVDIVRDMGEGNSVSQKSGIRYLYEIVLTADFSEVLVCSPVVISVNQVTRNEIETHLSKFGIEVVYLGE